MKMKSVLACGLAMFATIVTLTVSTDSTVSADSADQGHMAPQIAFDIAKSDVDLLVKNALPGQDQPLRVVDMGKYNMEVAVVHRPKGKMQQALYHNETPEVYEVISGSGTLVTGGTVMNKKDNNNYNIMNGPGGNAMPGNGSIARTMHVGDICIIPPGVLHMWVDIPDHVDYLSFRPDPDRVLPAGYVNPWMLKNSTEMPPTRGVGNNNNDGAAKSAPDQQ